MFSAQVSEKQHGVGLEEASCTRARYCTGSIGHLLSQIDKHPVFYDLR